MSLYQFSKLTRSQQAEAFAVLKHDIDIAQLAGQPTLVMKYHLACMYHVMMGITRKGNNVQKLVDRGDRTPDPQYADGGADNLGTRFGEEILRAFNG